MAKLLLSTCSFNITPCQPLSSPDDSLLGKQTTTLTRVIVLNRPLFQPTMSQHVSRLLVQAFSNKKCSGNVVCTNPTKHLWWRAQAFFPRSLLQGSLQSGCYHSIIPIPNHGHGCHMLPLSGSNVQYQRQTPIPKLPQQHVREQPSSPYPAFKDALTADWEAQMSL